MIAERDYRLDFLRAAAIVGVLIIHSVGRYAASATQFEHFLCTWFDVLSRPCIAVFLFLAGYLFKADADSKYLLRRFERVLIPYLLFSVIALLCQYRLGILSYIVDHPGELVLRIVFANTWPMYYFVFVILCLYVIAYMLNRVNAGLGASMCLVLLLFGLNLIHAAYSQQINEKLLHLDAQAFTFYKNRSLILWLPFFFLGALSRRSDLYGFVDRHKTLLRASWLLVLGTYTGLLLLPLGQVNLSGYNSVMGTTYSVATIFFLFTFHFKSAVCEFLSKISYSIYLSHIFFVYAFVELERRLNAQWPVWFWVISFVVSLAGSLGVYYVAKGLLGSRSRMLVGA